MGYENNITLNFPILIFYGKAHSESMFQSNSPSILSLDGSAMKALKIVCDEFLANGKDIREFNIIISEKLTKTTKKTRPRAYLL